MQGARDVRVVPLLTSKGAKALEVGVKFRGRITGTALLCQKEIRMLMGGPRETVEGEEFQEEI